jgi:hypothetical protein
VWLQPFQANRLGFAQQDPLGLPGSSQQRLDSLRVKGQSGPLGPLPNPALIRIHGLIVSNGDLIVDVITSKAAINPASTPKA